MGDTAFDCKESQLLIGYFSTSLVQALIGGLEIGWLENRPDLSAFIPLAASARRPDYDSQEARWKAQEEFITEFFRTEGNGLSDCLRHRCKIAVTFTDDSPQVWADIWESGMKFEYCLRSRNRASDLPAFKTLLQDAPDIRDRTYIYRAAINGLIPQCIPTTIVKERFLPIVFRILKN